MLMHHYARHQVLSLPDKIGSFAGRVPFSLCNCCGMKSSTKYFRFIENNISTLKKQNFHDKNVAINILKEKNDALERTE